MIPLNLLEGLQQTFQSYYTEGRHHPSFYLMSPFSKKSKKKRCTILEMKVCSEKIKNNKCIEKIDKIKERKQEKISSFYVLIFYFLIKNCLKNKN